MNLLQKFCSAVVNASDAIGASMQGVDVKTHRANLYGHPEGIVAARTVGAVVPRQAEEVHPERSEEDWLPHLARMDDLDPCSECVPEALPDAAPYDAPRPHCSAIDWICDPDERAPVWPESRDRF